MNGILLEPTQRWECPNCVQKSVTHKTGPYIHMHPCRGLAGLAVPMVPAGTRCKIEAKEREDYCGRELVQTDGNGRPIMSVVTTRDDGQDCTIYAPTATMTAAGVGI